MTGGNDALFRRYEMGEITKIGVPSMGIKLASVSHRITRSISLTYHACISQASGGAVKQRIIDFLTGNLDSLSRRSKEAHQMFSFWVEKATPAPLPDSLMNVRNAVAGVKGVHHNITTTYK